MGSERGNARPAQKPLSGARGQPRAPASGTATAPQASGEVPLTIENAEYLYAAVEACQADAGFLSELADILARADAAAAAVGVACRADGACCRFDTSGLRLFASTGELALLAAEGPPHPQACLPLRCPYQSGDACTARARRPLGCRTFFCDPATADWSARTYEDLHRDIRRLHEARGLPYAYAELTAALARRHGPPYGGP